MKNDKNILITGARNTAIATAELFASKGYNIHLASRRQSEVFGACEALKEKFPEVKVYGYSFDQNNTDSIENLFKELRKNTAALDGFVANAAALGIGLDIYNTSPEDFDAVMNVNVRGTFFLCKEAGRLMTKSGGSIVLLGSVQSKGAVEGRSVYSISKAAVSMMAKTLAFDFAPYSIRVNCLIAGAIRTDRWENLTDEETAKRRENYPLGREVEMSEIAEGIYYFISDKSKCTTGAELVIDSGVLVPLLPYSSRKDFKRDNY